MKFGKEFASYQSRLQESSDLPARFTQVDYRALKKILRRCISSRALCADLQALAEQRTGEGETPQSELLTEKCPWTHSGAPAAAKAQAPPSEAPPPSETPPPLETQRSVCGCARCDGEFFALLEAALASIETSFNAAATRLLSCHNASGLQLLCHVLSPRHLFAGSGSRNHHRHSHKPASLHRAATSLLDHLAISYLATNKILKKYIKVHHKLDLPVAAARASGNQVTAPESWEHVVGTRALQRRIVRSPLLIELSAMAANLELSLKGGRGGERRHGEKGGEGCGDFNGGKGAGRKDALLRALNLHQRRRHERAVEQEHQHGTVHQHGKVHQEPRLGQGGEETHTKEMGSQCGVGREGSVTPGGLCTLLGSELQLRAEFKAKVDVTCPICLEVAFDPVSLGCGHIFCLGCACSVAHIPVFFGLDTASPYITCPLCRQKGVFGQPRSLKELQRLIMARQPEQWKERRDEEQKRRLEEERLYWDGQMRLAMHIL